MRSATPARFSPVRIGTAGWSIPRQHADAAAGEGSHLARYARVLSCTEVNSRFYRPHKPETWLKWAASTPSGFRFSVKLPKAITHEAKLACSREELQAFFIEVGSLGERLGPVLIQLPPKLSCDAVQAKRFFVMLRKLHAGPVALEPRHASWFSPEVDALLRDHRIARVAADPPKPKEIVQAATPGGWPGLVYYRLHGSPRVYYSEYSDEYLRDLAQKMQAHVVEGSETWCIFDNTASGAALGNALRLQSLFCWNEAVRLSCFALRFARCRLLVI